MTPLEPNTAPSEPKEWQPSVERAGRLRQLDALLAGKLEKDEEVALLVERATLLTAAGRSLEARSDYFRVLVLAPTHLPNLFGLGRLLAATGQRKAAQVVFTEAVKHHPGDIASRVNLGSVLLEGEEPAVALVQYQAALAIDPNFPQAHGGMYYALKNLGQPEAAEQHRAKAFGQKNVFTAPYRGEGPPIPILLLMSSKSCSTNASFKRTWWLRTSSTQVGRCRNTG
jgi:tetratricopeptide (TPR) repeat protein